MFEFDHENISEIFFNVKNTSSHMVHRCHKVWQSDRLTDELQELLELLFATENYIYSELEALKPCF